jgi:hypothetical protein
MSYAFDHSVRVNSRWVPTCVLCNNPVEIETCKVDERGKAIHEECYLRKIRRKSTSKASWGLGANLDAHFRTRAKALGS